VYFFKHKSQTFIYFKRFKAFLENAIGKKIQCLRSDKGSGNICLTNSNNILLKLESEDNLLNHTHPAKMKCWKKIKLNIDEKIQIMVYETWVLIYL
jgi:hypothetical protein